MSGGRDAALRAIDNLRAPAPGLVIPDPDL